MYFCNIFHVFIWIVMISKLTAGGRVATFKEYKLLDSLDKSMKSSENTDVGFYFNTIEKVDKFEREAIDIQDLYKELMRRTFGITFTKTTTTTEKMPALGAPRKVSDDWVRSSFDYDLINQRRFNRNIRKNQIKNPLQSIRL